MLATVADWLQRLYPTKTWGQLDDDVASHSGISQEDAQALAEEFATELKAATLYCAGTEEDLCDYIYILCQGREPCALQIQEGTPIPEELGPDDIVSELYLRVSLSSISPLVAVQEVSIVMSMVDGDWMVQEEFASGVYSAPLLKRFQRLVALLPAYDLIHVDMGEISTPPPGYDHGAYEEMYRCAPHQSNYLFFRHSSSMRITRRLLPGGQEAPS